MYMEGNENATALEAAKKVQEKKREKRAGISQLKRELLELDSELEAALAPIIKLVGRHNAYLLIKGFADRTVPEGQKEYVMVTVTRMVRPEFPKKAPHPIDDVIKSILNSPLRRQESILPQEYIPFQEWRPGFFDR